MDRYEALQKLDEIKDDLANHRFSDIKKLIQTSMGRIGLPIAILHKHAAIDRVRINRTEDLFTKESEITYIKDPDVIENFMDKYGRANKKKQVRFYGAIESPLIPQQRVTAVLETCQHILKDPEAELIDGQLVTMSRWILTTPLKVAEIVFSPQAIKTNPAVKSAFHFHLAKLHGVEEKDFFIKLAHFYSSQFARDINDNNDYKISSVFSEIIMDDFEFPGIVYPSVPSNYMGQNVVLKTEFADQFLQLSVVSTMKIHKFKMQQVFNNHKYVSDFGDNNESFTWVDTDPEFVRTQEQINESFGL